MDDFVVVKNSIMFMRGLKLVHMQKFDDFYRNRMLDEDKANDDFNILKQDTFNEYTELPREYNVHSKWVKTSNCKCWYCDLTFTTVPVFVPTNFYINKNGDEEFTTEGNFCSFNCAQTYINIKYSSARNTHNETYTRLLRKLFFKFTGQQISIIKESPDKTRMKHYMGERGITVQEYRQELEQINALYMAKSAR